MTQRPGLQHERLSILFIMSIGLLSSTVLCGVSADYPPHPDLDHLQPGRSCVSLDSRHYLVGGWDLRLNSQGFADHISSSPDSGDTVKTLDYSLGNQPSLDGKCPQQGITHS